MKQKIIFLDIDGTLTEPGTNEPPATAIEAIEQARKEGHYVFLCTGRTYKMLSPLLKYEFDGVIACSGGYIEYNKQVIYNQPFSEEQKELAMAVLEKNGIYRTVECHDGSYTDEGFKEFLRANADKGGNSEFLRWREQIEKTLNILPMKEYKGQPAYKIVLMSPSEENLKEPKTVLSDNFVLCIQEGNKGGFINGELLVKGVDKGAAVKMVCEHLHIPVADSIAFGDSMNDIEMMEAAGLGICMENGSETLKKMAHDICPSVSEDGLKKAFLKYQLIHQQ